MSNPLGAAVSFPQAGLLHLYGQQLATDFVLVPLGYLATQALISCDNAYAA
jgi:hypothetical protein